MDINTERKAYVEAIKNDFQNLENIGKKPTLYQRFKEWCLTVNNRVEEWLKSFIACS